VNTSEKISLHGHHYGPDLYPVPVTLVTSELNGIANFLPICWTGVLCSRPPIVYISVRPERFSYRLIAESGKFVINIPSGDQLEMVDLSGKCSGRNTDKFQKFNLTKKYPVDGYPPVVAECRHHLFCDLLEIKKLGTHDLFIAEIKHEMIDKDCLDQNEIVLSKINPIVYCPNNYMLITDSVGKFGQLGR